MHERFREWVQSSIVNGPRRRLLRGFSALLMTLAYGAVAAAAPSVLQRGYTAGVVGANPTETILTTANVSASTFGRIFSLPLDGRMYAQPLYVPGVAIPGQGTHNVLYVATMADTIFAFDADTPAAPLWSVTYLAPGATAVPIVTTVGTDSDNIAGTVGIESTPVIDPTTNTMYFVTNTLESGSVVFRLHAIDITTGAEKLGGPTIISGSFTAGGKTITFTPNLENQRVSLALAQNQVIIGFGSHEDFYTYYGWIMAYDETSLAQTGIFNPTPTDDHGGAVWQSGRPPVVDSSGYVYVYVGNSFLASGSSSTWDGVNNFTESVLKLDPGHGMKLVDYFTPANYQSLDNNDQDLSSSGPTLIPGTNLLVGGGKNGTIYLLNTQNLGKLQTNDAGATQSFAGAAGQIRGGPVYWQRSTAGGGPLLFNWAGNDALKAFSFNGTTLVTTPAAQYTPPINLYPGGELALSSNGDNQGIVWALINGQGDADHRVPPGILVAVNAANVSQLLWSSTANAPRDDFGLLAKWVPPVVANGKVYVGTSSNQVAVYGLLPTGGATVTAWPATETALGGTAAFTVAALSNAGTALAASWSVAGLPTGATATFGTDAQGQTVLQVTTGATTPVGAYTLLISATVSGAVTTQSALLQITQATIAPLATVSADSAYASNPASYAIDGLPATFWHSLYGTTTPSYPHELTIDLGSVKSVTGVSYLARQDGCINGTVLQYEVHTSTDGVNFPEVTGGSFDYGPAWHTFNCAGTAFLLPKRLNIAFPATSARYVEVVGLGSVIDGNPWASAAEIEVFTASGSTAPTATATPGFSVAAGSYAASQTVSLTDATPGAVIYYTTNGTTPTTASTVYTGALTVSTTTTIEAVALATGYTSSAVASATYTIAALNSQTIAFAAIAAQKAGATVTLSATATSGLAVTFSSSTPTICSVTGSSATMLAAGTCTLVASQAGNGSYAAAVPVSQSFAVTGAASSFTLTASAASVSVTPPTCFFSFCFGGTSATDTFTVKAVNGFSGTVSLSITGLPTGVTAAFSPTSVASGASSKLTLTPASTAGTGKVTTLTINGVSGSGAAAVSAKTSVSLSY